MSLKPSHGLLRQTLRVSALYRRIFVRGICSISRASGCSRGPPDGQRMKHVRMARPQAFWQQRAWKYAAVYGLLAAIVLYPIAMVRVPGLEDYPNHLARMYILSHYNESEALQRFYEVRWRPIPYLGMDATFVLLSRIASIYDAGRLFVGLCVLLPVLSVAALHFSVHRRPSLVPAGAFLLSYNALLLWGFLSYLPVLCLAVIVFAGWIATIHWPRGRRLIVFSVLATILYLGHCWESRLSSLAGDYG